MTRSPAIVVLAWLALGAVVLVFEAGPTDEPGMYYDEAFLAQQARDFLEPGRRATHPPSVRSTWILGRPFPLQNAAYLGSLKSQLLIPALATFGPSLATVRIATLCTGLLGLLFAMLWARRLLGPAVAVVGGALVALDPSFVFYGEYEWGPYTTLLLCRSLGFWLVTIGWQERRTWMSTLGGLVLGLGVYARADFAVVLAAAGVALFAVRDRALLAEARERAATVALAGAALVAGAAPMWLAMLDVLSTGAGISGRGDLAYKARVLWSTLDGGSFYAVLATGGLFEKLFDVDAPASALAPAVLLAVLVVGWQLARHRSAEPAREALGFLWLFTVVLAGCMLLVPGAVRAHHMLNLLPLPHLLVAAAVVSVFAHGPAGARGRSRPTAAGIAAALLLAVLASEARVTLSTRALLAETGGRGRWSHALNELAVELESDPTAAAISLDWGFHEPLQFLTTSTPLLEPIWAIPTLLQRGQPWVHRGTPSHRYLVHDAPYDLFQLGPRFLQAARDVAGLAAIRAHRDRGGEIAFYSVRFRKPHVLAYTGEFHVQFAEAAAEPRSPDPVP